MSRNREQEAREEHAQRDDHSPRKCIPQRPIHEPTLKPNERRENNQRCRQDVPDGDTVDKDVLCQPPTLQDRLYLDKWDSCVGAAEGEAAGDEAQDEEVDEGWSLADSQSECDWGWDAAENYVQRIADVLEDEEKAGGDPEASSDQSVKDAVDAERDEAGTLTCQRSTRKSSFAEPEICRRLSWSLTCLSALHN
jgi:hypothetical protein